jgi:hypothetical protein
MVVRRIMSMSIVGSLIAAALLGGPAPTSALTGSSGPDRSDLPRMLSHDVSGRSFVDSASDDSAIVVRGFFCGIPVRGHGEVPTTNSHTVVTPSGNAATSCHADTEIVVPRAVVVKDIPCATIGPVGTDSHVVVNPSGRVNFWCHHHR